MDLIIGAGVSGLSYAAATEHDYLVIEAEESIGGYCKIVVQKHLSCITGVNRHNKNLVNDPEHFNYRLY